MKMLKVLIVGILMLLIPGVTMSQEIKMTLVSAFLETKAQLEIIEINDWSMINSDFITFDEMEQIRDKIIELFETEEENFHCTKEFDDMYRIMDTEGLTSSGDFLRIILHTVRLPEEYENRTQTYLVVNVSGQDLSGVTQLSDKVGKAIEDAGGNSRISTCITGTFNGKLTENAVTEVSNKITGFLGITSTDTYSDENTFSVIGFSPALPEGIEVLGKNYNVNIAMRYNTIDDKTYLWMGTPVISAEH